MLHSNYAMGMGRKPKDETPVHNRLEEVREYSPSLSLALTLARVLKTNVQDIFALAPFHKKKESNK